jgi:hypothetical protein
VACLFHLVQGSSNFVPKFTQFGALLEFKIFHNLMDEY